MVSMVDEAAKLSHTQLAAALAAGVNNLSLNQTITFRKYQRAVLPIDGYVFWVKVPDATPLTVQGSLHYASDTQMEAEEVYTLNRVIFTSLKEVNNLNEITPDTIWIGDFEGMKFAFNSRGSFYRQATLYHYVGNAIYADMQTQVVDDASKLLTNDQIISNSLPFWLNLNGYEPLNTGVGPPCPFMLYPARLSPQNLAPPYATVDISAEATEMLASAPTLTSDASHYQLGKDTVRITMWGVRNADALTFIDCVNAYSLNYPEFGIMNVPTVQDLPRSQSELGTLAMKKGVTFEVSYYQYTARQVARKLITAATAALYTGS